MGIKKVLLERKRYLVTRGCKKILDKTNINFKKTKEIYCGEHIGSLVFYCNKCLKKINKHYEKERKFKDKK